MKIVMNELMRRVRYQRILLVLLMLVFGGQVMASANISCQNQTSSPQSTEQAMGSDMVDHSQHLGLNSSADEATSLDCCPDCDCSVGGCSASAALPTTQELFSPYVVLLTSRYNELVDDQLSVSLFRPPISR